ncbi:MAG: hypothetical protein WDZ59_13775 [Pirellulales bacterium]
MRVKKKTLWAMLLVPMLLLAMLFAWLLVQWFQLDPTITVSPQTTHWVEPLDEHGLPDYRRIILDAQRVGVTPENNGAIPFWQAMWPGDLGSSREAQTALLAELGIPTPRPGLKSVDEQMVADYLRHLHEQQTTPELAFTNQPDNPSGESDRNLDDDAALIANLLREQPWSAESLPRMAQWIQDNGSLIDLLVVAGEKPQFFNPSPSLITGKDQPLYSTLLPGVNMMRDATKILYARAMLRTGSGQYDEAWRDMKAAYGLGDHLDEPYAGMVQVLVRVTIQSQTNQAVLHLLAQPDLPQPLAEEILRELSQRRKIHGIARSLDELERMMALDLVIRLSKGTLSENQLKFLDESWALRNASQLNLVDWNIVLEELNRWYDRMAASARTPVFEQRQADFAAIDHDINQLADEPFDVTDYFAGETHSSHKAADQVAVLWLPAFDKAVQAEDRTNTQFDLVRLAAALAVYRAEHGVYPDSLDALKPEILAELPTDLFHGAPFGYRKTSDGFLVYSLGPNGTDDDGSTQQRNTYQGYAVTDWNGAAVAEALGVMIQTPPDQSPEAAARQAALLLKTKIPASADDFAIRMPPVLVEWHIEARTDAAAPSE